jgi:hypothetical protein
MNKNLQPHRDSVQNVECQPANANLAAGRGTYRRPEVQKLGTLEVVELGRYGNNYDGSCQWWYYE